MCHIKHTLTLPYQRDESQMLQEVRSQRVKFPQTDARKINLKTGLHELDVGEGDGVDGFS